MHYGPVRVKLKSSLILVVYLCILVEIVAIPVKNRDGRNTMKTMKVGSREAGECCAEGGRL